MSSPEAVKLCLEGRYPWLHSAMVQAQLSPIISGQIPNRYVSWYPTKEMREALRKLPGAADQSPIGMEQAAALDAIVQSLVSPINLSQTGQVESFVNRFLQAPSLRRPHRIASPWESWPEDWVQLGDVDEHARWIQDERQLLDLLGDQLRRQRIVVDGTSQDDDLTKTALLKRGDFVAVTDSEGRFIRLLDRTALLENVAAGGQ